MLINNIPSYYPIIDLVVPGAYNIPDFEPYKGSESIVLPSGVSEFCRHRWYVLVSNGIGKEGFIITVPAKNLYNVLRHSKCNRIQALQHPSDRDGRIFLYISKYHFNA